MMRAYEVPEGMILLGTCGACGGPVLAPMYVLSTGTGVTPVIGACGYCQRRHKQITPVYGPVLEMEP